MSQNRTTSTVTWMRGGTSANSPSIEVEDFLFEVRLRLNNLMAQSSFTIELPPDAALALANAIHYHAKRAEDQRTAYDAEAARRERR